jgi:ABC-2 type transport system ATP-binding protein
LIEAHNLSMTYGTTRALDDASFQVKSGEILGLLGPNGAGKTTTLRILTTFIHPTAGKVVIDGVDAAEDPIAVRRRIGYLPETAPLYQDMMVCEYLEFVGAARGLAGGRLATRLDAVVEACALQGVYTKPIAHLSKGYRQRTGLAQALIHDPDILILDEPTSGLDPLQILGIRELVRSLGRTKTVLFSTHILQEVEAVSDRIMIMNEGRIIAEGTPEALTARAMGNDRLLVEVTGPPDDVSRALAGVGGIVSIETLPGSSMGTCAFAIRHEFGDELVPRRVDDAVRAGGWAVRRLAPERYSLEQVFISLIRAAASESAGRGVA